MDILERTVALTSMTAHPTPASMEGRAWMGWPASLVRTVMKDMRVTGVRQVSFEDY